MDGIDNRSACAAVNVHRGACRHSLLHGHDHRCALPWGLQHTVHSPGDVQRFQQPPRYRHPLFHARRVSDGNGRVVEKAGRNRKPTRGEYDWRIGGRDDSRLSLLRGGFGVGSCHYCGHRRNHDPFHGQDMRYKKDYSTGLVACAGGLGVIMPPSIPFVIYGFATDTSIGDLFLAGVIPCLCRLPHASSSCRTSCPGRQDTQGRVSPST